jgi:hypothetical protein
VSILHGSIRLVWQPLARVGSCQSRIPSPISWSSSEILGGCFSFNRCVKRSAGNQNLRKLVGLCAQKLISYPVTRSAHHFLGSSNGEVAGRAVPNHPIYFSGLRFDYMRVFRDETTGWPISIQPSSRGALPKRVSWYLLCTWKCGKFRSWALADVLPSALSMTPPLSSYPYHGTGMQHIVSTLMLMFGNGVEDTHLEGDRPF